MKRFNRLTYGDGSGDGQIAVQADGAQVEDGGGAHPDVDGQPYRAPELAENPQVEHLHRGAERQHGQAHQQVGHGQRHDEQVRHCRPKPFHRVSSISPGRLS